MLRRLPLARVLSAHVFQAVAFGDEDDPVFGDGQPAAAVEVEVVADLHAGGHLDPLVDDRPADFGVAAPVIPA